VAIILIDAGMPLPMYMSYFNSLSISSIDFALSSFLWMGTNTVKNE